MNRFDRDYKKNPFFFLKYIPFILLVGIIIFFAFSVTNLHSSTISSEEELLNTALSRSIVQCYALTGAYPPSLEYIESEYGLTYDKTMFYVDYQPIASNILPNITIIRKITTTSNE